MITNLTILSIVIIAMLLAVYIAAFAGHYTKFKMRGANPYTKNVLSIINVVLLLISLAVICQGVSDSSFWVFYPGFLLLVFSAVNRYSH